MADAPRRRQLHFDTIDEVVENAQQLASGDVETTGKFTYGQILEHLARTLDVVTGHIPGASVTFPMRMMARIMRPFILSRPMSPGFKLPATAQAVYWPSEAVDTSAALAHLKEAVERYKQNGPIPKHPVFGTMTRRQHDQLQCRHCALHLSFVHPVSTV